MKMKTMKVIVLLCNNVISILSSLGKSRWQEMCHSCVVCKVIDKIHLLPSFVVTQHKICIPEILKCVVVRPRSRLGLQVHWLGMLWISCTTHCTTELEELCWPCPNVVNLL